MSTTAQESLGSSNSTSMGYIENSTNATTQASSWLPLDFDTSTGIKTASILLLFIVSLPGNFLLVAVLLKNANKRMRTPSNYFILSMACGDILLTVYSMPQFGILTAYRFRWLVGGVAGEVLCRLSFFVGQYSVLVSTGSLLAIALDRLFLVFYPLRRKTTLCTAKYAIAVIWLSSTIFALPSLRLFNTVEIGPGYLLCMVEFKLIYFAIFYLLFCFSILIALPLLITIALYIAIGIKLNRTKRPGNQLPSNRERREQMNHKILTMLVTVVAVLIICRFPLIVGMLSCFLGSTKVCREADFIFTGWFLTYANSPINPWIYFIFNVQFRHGAKLLLMKIFPCCFKALNEVGDVESVGVHVEMETLK